MCLQPKLARMGLSLADISLMTGDKNSNIKTILAGYYFMAQLEENKLFSGENTLRKGRGSNVDYPFSWVYTLLGYTLVKDFLSLVVLDGDSISKSPIPRESLEKAKFLVDAMFGNTAEGKDSLLKDSRELGTLAVAVSTPQKYFLLKNGKKLEEVERITAPLKDRIDAVMFQCIESINEVNIRFMQQDVDLSKSDLNRFHDLSTQLMRVVKGFRDNIDKSIRNDDENFNI